MKTKLAMCILIVLSLSLILAGCWDRREINTLGIVDSIGIDRKDNLFEVTMELVSPSGLASQQGTGGEKKTIVQKAAGATIFKAIRNLNFFLSRKPYISHNRILIIGEEMAREGIKPAIEFSKRDPELRRTMYLIISRGKVTEIFETRGRLENSIGMKISSIIDNYWASSFLPRVTVNDFSMALSSSTDDPFAPVVAAVSNPVAEKPMEIEEEKIIYIEGMAVFNNDRLKGFLNTQETRGVLWVRGDVRGGIISLTSEENEDSISDTSIEIRKVEVKLVPLIEGDIFTIDIQIDGEGNVGAYSGTLDLFDPEVIKYLEKLTVKVIEEEIKLAINKVKKEYKADIFGFGGRFIKKYPTKKEELEKNWKIIYPNIEISSKINFKIRELGL